MRDLNNIVPRGRRIEQKEICCVPFREFFCLLVYIAFNSRSFDRSWVADNLEVAH